MAYYAYDKIKKFIFMVVFPINPIKIKIKKIKIHKISHDKSPNLCYTINMIILF